MSTLLGRSDTTPTFNNGSNSSRIESTKGSASISDSAVSGRFSDSTGSDVDDDLTITPATNPNLTTNPNPTTNYNPKPVAPLTFIHHKSTAPATTTDTPSQTPPETLTHTPATYIHLTDDQWTIAFVVLIYSILLSLSVVILDDLIVILFFFWWSISRIRYLQLMHCISSYLFVSYWLPLSSFPINCQLN